MGTVRKPNRNTFGLVIIVDNVNAIKVWLEQIECALAGLKPTYNVARSGISLLDRNKNYSNRRINCCICLTQNIRHLNPNDEAMDRKF